MTLDGTLTTLFSFCPADCSAGYLPIAGLIEGSDGKLYGTTDSVEGCEPLACGAAYKMTFQGDVTAIHTFCATTGCPDVPKSASTRLPGDQHLLRCGVLGWKEHEFTMH